MAPFLRRFEQKKRAKRAGENRQVRQRQPDKIPVPVPQNVPAPAAETEGWHVLRTYQIPSEVGNERLAMAYVAESLNAFHLSERRLDQLGTAVAEATMNAMEHGNHYNPQIPAVLEVCSSEHAIAVRISDQGGSGQVVPPTAYEAPDIAAKLAELQTARGWGLFLIQNMVDEMHVLSDEKTHTVELILHLEGKQ